MQFIRKIIMSYYNSAGQLALLANGRRELREKILPHGEGLDGRNSLAPIATVPHPADVNQPNSFYFFRASNSSGTALNKSATRP